jgi:hypothetical protein
MIYLIDDNQGDLRRNHLNIHFVELNPPPADSFCLKSPDSSYN